MTGEIPLSVRGPSIDVRSLLDLAAEALHDAADGVHGEAQTYLAVERELRHLIAALDEEATPPVVWVKRDISVRPRWWRKRREEREAIKNRTHPVYSRSFLCSCGADLSEQTRRKMTYGDRFCDNAVVHCSSCGQWSEAWFR